MMRKDWGTRSYENASGALLGIIVGAALAVGMTASLLTPLACRGDAAEGPPIVIDRIEIFVDPREPEPFVTYDGVVLETERLGALRSVR